MPATATRHRHSRAMGASASSPQENPTRCSTNNLHPSSGDFAFRAQQAPLSLPADTKKRVIGVLGGSFDPITDGHLKCACEIVHAGVADEVWLVPCGVRPDKPSLLTPYLHRLIMCHLAINTSFGSSFPIRACDIEMGEEMALSTYHLMKRLKEQYPGPEFKFVLGGDLIAGPGSLRTWDAPGVPDAGERLYKESKFILLDRAGFAVPPDLPPNFTRLKAREGTNMVTEDVSSSEIRRRMNIGKEDLTGLTQGNYQMVDGLLSPPVLAHIIRYKLYITR
uniref:Cytidyltransferase-like domain-containing protein n=1 Tax=Calcidiscus leptoporus TaxID=127549 RepID=A0A7S0J7S3_9EUKA